MIKIRNKIFATKKRQPSNDNYKRLYAVYIVRHVDMASYELPT